MSDQLALFSPQVPADFEDLAGRAASFCEVAPHKHWPYARRDWGGPLHSLCSYQGKLKPAIAYYLVRWFTIEGERILDPLSGVGTIPLEARRQGRVGIATDLSPLAVAVSRAKLEPASDQAIRTCFSDLASALASGPSLNSLEKRHNVDFGLNGRIREYFHPETLRELLVAREFFGQLLRSDSLTPASALLLASLLHILHGNRPYALSRRSHPVTPFAPTGDFVYRSVLDRLLQRLQRILPELRSLDERCEPGTGIQADFRAIDIAPVDAIITSPPFSRSLRFWSSNWMRLWFAGWEPADFRTEPSRYLEAEQRTSFAVYSEFAEAMWRHLRSGGRLIMHLGETATANMVEGIVPKLDPYFKIVYIGRESVADTESHGLRDKGSTLAHWYVFAEKRADGDLVSIVK